MSNQQTAEPVTDLVPREIGGVMVPKTVDALEKLLEANRNRAWPLPFRADVLPEPVRIMLYSLGGIPADMPPGAVEIFAGRPYVTAEGSVDMAILKGCKVWTDPQPELLSCLDPKSGCPGERVIKQKNGPDKVIKATDKDFVFVVTGHVFTRERGEITAYGRCCAHTWAGASDKRLQMAETRALRRAAKTAMRLPDSIVRGDDEDVIDVEVVDQPSDVGAGGDAEFAAPPSPPATTTDAAGDGTGTEPQEEAAPDAVPPDSAGDTPADGEPEGVYVGELLVPPAKGGPYAPADDRAEFRTKEQVDGLKVLLGELGLVDGALDAVHKARYRDEKGRGVPVAQSTRIMCSELKAFLDVKIALRKGAA